MSTPSPSELPADWRMVHSREYPDSLDLTGKDLISLLGHSKEEVSTLVGRIADKAQMQTEELPGDYVTSLTGEIADEVHEWPNAKLGKAYRHLMLQFRQNRLVNMSWKFRGPAAPPGKPWWKFWS
jgi:hypothetical protein